MITDKSNQKKIKNVCTTGLIIMTFFLGLITVLLMFLTGSSFFSLIIIIFIGFIPTLILLVLNLINNKNYLFIKKIFPYHIILIVFFISLIAGGVRSISLLCLFIVPFLAFSLEENIIIPSILIFSIFSGLVITWLNPLMDRFMLKFNVFAIDTLIAPNTVYIIFYYTVFFISSIFSYMFDKENKKYRMIIENEEKYKAVFFTNFAHEIRMPLMTIGNRLNKLNTHVKNRLTDTEAIENLDILINNYEKIENDIINFLDMEKLENGMIVYNHDSIAELKYIIEEKMKLFQENAKIKNIKMTGSLEKAYVKIDIYALNRIINNLLDNAIKFNKENGEIKVTLANKDKKVILKIEDTGIGIDDKRIKNIFIPYHQALPCIKENLQGMGIGLSLVKNILEGIKADIKVESRKNTGSTFTITFTKADSCEAIHNVEITKILKNKKIELFPEKKFNKDQPVILLVDDDMEILLLIQKEFFEIFNIYTAINGIEALKKLKVIPKPDIFISDIMMSGMNGIEFCKIIKSHKRYKNIPFIMLTAKASSLDVKMGYIRGVDDYITKPVNIGELYLKIEKLLERKIRVIRELKMEKRERIINLYKTYKITEQEQFIIYFLKKGIQNKEIADKLDISENTVRNHLQNIFNKINAKTRIDVLKFFS